MNYQCLQCSNSAVVCFATLLQNTGDRSSDSDSQGGHCREDKEEGEVDFERILRFALSGAEQLQSHAESQDVLVHGNTCNSEQQPSDEIQSQNLVVE